MFKCLSSKASFCECSTLLQDQHVRTRTLHLLVILQHAVSRSLISLASGSSDLEESSSQVDMFEKEEHSAVSRKGKDACTYSVVYLVFIALADVESTQHLFLLLNTSC